jgi:hypothetical protein
MKVLLKAVINFSKENKTEQPNNDQFKDSSKEDLSERI